MNKLIILGVLALLIVAGWFGFNAKSAAKKTVQTITAGEDGGV